MSPPQPGHDTVPLHVEGGVGDVDDDVGDVGPPADLVLAQYHLRVAKHSKN